MKKKRKYTRKLWEPLRQKRASLFKHSPRCLISNTRLTLNLFSRDTAPSRRHSINNLEPDSKRGSRFMKDCSGCREHLATAIVTSVAGTTSYLMMLCHLLALRTIKPIRPAKILNIFKDSFIIWEFLFKICGSVFLHLTYPFPSFNRVSIAENILVVKG